MCEEEYLKKLEQIKENNIKHKYRFMLFIERLKVFNIPKIETSKFFAIYLFILLNAIVIFSMITMWKFADLTYLGVLITDIAAQVLVYGIYCLKAYHGKKQEELLKFNKEQLNINIKSEEEAVG